MLRGIGRLYAKNSDYKMDPPPSETYRIVIFVRTSSPVLKAHLAKYPNCVTRAAVRVGAHGALRSTQEAEEAGEEDVGGGVGGGDGGGETKGGEEGCAGQHGEAGERVAMYANCTISLCMDNAQETHMLCAFELTAPLPGEDGTAEGGGREQGGLGGLGVKKRKRMVKKETPPPMQPTQQTKQSPPQQWGGGAISEQEEQILSSLAPPPHTNSSAAAAAAEPSGMPMGVGGAAMHTSMQDDEMAGLTGGDDIDDLISDTFNIEFDDERGGTVWQSSHLFE